MPTINLDNSTKRKENVSNNLVLNPSHNVLYNTQAYKTPTQHTSYLGLQYLSHYVTPTLRVNTSNNNHQTEIQQRRSLLTVPMSLTNFPQFNPQTIPNNQQRQSLRFCPTRCNYIYTNTKDFTRKLKLRSEITILMRVQICM